MEAISCPGAFTIRPYNVRRHTAVIEFETGKTGPTFYTLFKPYPSGGQAFLQNRVIKLVRKT